MKERFPADSIAQAVSADRDGLFAWPDPVPVHADCGLAGFGPDGGLIWATPLYWFLTRLEPEDYPPGARWQAMSVMIYRLQGYPVNEAGARSSRMAEHLRAVGGCVETLGSGASALSLSRRIQQDGSGIEVICAARVEDDSAAARRIEILAGQVRAAEMDARDLTQFIIKDLHGPVCDVERFVQRASGSGVPQGLRDAFDRVCEKTGEMRRKTDRLLDYLDLRQRPLRCEKVDLTVQLENVLATLQPRLQEAKALIEYAALPRIEADPGQIRCLLRELLDNALRYRRLDGASIIRVTAVETDDDQLRLDVQDYGTGFDASQATAVFRMFRRLHGAATHPGAGMGLAICRLIAERHNGSIEATSSEETGTTMSVLLPRTQPATDR